MSTKSTRIADWVLLLMQLPGESPRPAGILLLDPAEDQLHVSLAKVVCSDEDIQEVWDALPQDLAERASELGGARLLGSLEDDLSMFLQIAGPRQHVATADPERTLQDLFQKQVTNASAASQGE